MTYPNTDTYTILDSGEVYLTGARLSGLAADYVKMTHGYARLSALDITLLHASFEADMVCEWTYFVAHLPEDLRERLLELDTAPWH